MRRILIPVAHALLGLASAAPIYTLTDIGPGPGGEATFASGLSQNGRVSGYYSAFPVLGGLSWSAGTATYVPDTFMFTGINNAGQASAFDLTSTPQYWDGSALSALPLAVSESAGVARGINNSGVIAGWSINSVDSHNTIQATVWSGGIHSFLPLFGGYTASEAWAINDSGDVAGNVGNGLSAVAAVWTGGVGQLLPLPAGASASRANAISSNGRIAGIVFDATFTDSAAYYWEGGVATLITGGGNANALGVNGFGAVVGSVTSSAFLWQGGTLYDLNTLVSNGTGWNLLEATAINDAGQIVGYGSIDGEVHAFLLTPQADVPEPGTLLSSLAGLTLVIVLRSRRCS